MLACVDGSEHVAGLLIMTAPVEVYATLILIYFVVNALLSQGMRLLENRGRFGKLFARF